MRVFDPRDGQWKESDNPALMVAQLMRDAGGDVNEDAVRAAADFCDEPVETTSYGDQPRVDCFHEHTKSVQAVGDRVPRFHVCADCGAQLAACADCGGPINLSGGIGTGRPFQEHVHEFAKIEPAAKLTRGGYLRDNPFGPSDDGQSFLRRKK
jgi:hypothetical protein